MKQLPFIVSRSDFQHGELEVAEPSWRRARDPDWGRVLQFENHNFAEKVNGQSLQGGLPLLPVWGV